MKSDSTRVLVQKHSRLVTSSASVTPLRIVRFGVTTRTRPSEIPKGRVAMMPVFPQPTGICRIPGSCEWAKCSRTARCASFCGSRSKLLASMSAFGPAVLEPERLEIDEPVVTVPAAGPAHGGEPAVAVPTAQRLGRDTDVLRRLGHPDELGLAILTHLPKLTYLNTSHHLIVEMH